MNQRRIQDLHLLPKVRDSWSYLYVEHCRVEQDDRAIAVYDDSGKVPIPVAMLTLLMLGPGTSITHAAISVLAECGCLVVWVGEEGVRFYAQGMGETRSARNILRQARLYADKNLRSLVVRRLYEMRFNEPAEQNASIEVLRGREGLRVRRSYEAASKETGVPWSGRQYDRSQWESATPVNRALSCANSCLYGICHAAIVATGFSPAIGFIHTGKMLSFVYDIADLYKTDISIPIAFRAAADGPSDLETRVRYACRDAFASRRLLNQITLDIDKVLGEESIELPLFADDMIDTDPALPGPLWDPESGGVAGGVNRSEEEG
jgi:CRISPR-associated protein Cas1